MLLHTHPPPPLQPPGEPAVGKYPQQCHLLLLSSHGLGVSRQWRLSPGWAEQPGVPVPTEPTQNLIVDR